MPVLSNKEKNLRHLWVVITWIGSHILSIELFIVSFTCSTSTALKLSKAPENSWIRCLVRDKASKETANESIKKFEKAFFSARCPHKRNTCRPCTNNMAVQNAVVNTWKIFIAVSTKSLAKSDNFDSLAIYQATFPP